MAALKNSAIFSSEQAEESGGTDATGLGAFYEQAVHSSWKAGGWECKVQARFNQCK